MPKQSDISRYVDDNPNVLVNHSKATGPVLLLKLAHLRKEAARVYDSVVNTTQKPGIRQNINRKRGIRTSAPSYASVRAAVEKAINNASNEELRIKLKKQMHAYTSAVRHKKRTNYMPLFLRKRVKRPLDVNKEYENLMALVKIANRTVPMKSEKRKDSIYA